MTSFKFKNKKILRKFINNLSFLSWVSLIKQINHKANLVQLQKFNETT